MPKKRRNILIHPDHIENLDEKNRRLEANRKEPKATGYETVCTFRNTRKHRDVLLKTDFVRNKCKSGVFIIFKVVNRKEVMLQPVPVEFMNRTSICHVERRFLSHWRCYGYRARLERAPEPAMVFIHSGIDPLIPEYTFRMVEYSIQDEAFGEVLAYKLEPLHMK